MLLDCEFLFEGLGMDFPQQSKRCDFMHFMHVYPAQHISFSSFCPLHILTTSLFLYFMWTEVPGAQVQVCGGGPARGFLHPLRLVAGLQLWRRPPLEPARHRAVQHGLWLKHLLQTARVISVQYREWKKKKTVCVCVWVGVCALPFIVCARCFESASTLYRMVFLPFFFFFLCSATSFFSSYHNNFSASTLWSFHV